MTSQIRLVHLIVGSGALGSDHLLYPVVVDCLPIYRLHPSRERESVILTSLTIRPPETIVITVKITDAIENAPTA